ncbi:MAG: hypothetical protein QGG64_12560 [Candidatus Latescibacteria bacterium]|jgi:hypothetical protein|nr:hypothetical protein [Candidatus Latescibacterota bacterium]
MPLREPCCERIAERDDKKARLEMHISSRAFFVVWVFNPVSFFEDVTAITCLA